MRIGNYHFSPALAPAIVVLFLFPGLISLGIWQLDRADEKREIEDNVHLAELKSPFELHKASEADLLELRDQVYRPAIATGHYDSQHQFLYDNRTHKGKPGYHVLTPFLLSTKELKDKNVAVLVNRGWIPYIGRRDNIQDITVEDSSSSAAQVLEGTIKNPSKSIVLSEEEVTGQYPQTIQVINLEEMGEKLGYVFLPVVIELDKSASKGFVREWQPYYGTIEKHTGYAVQWFAMGVVLLILFLKLSTKKKN